MLIFAEGFIRMIDKERFLSVSTPVLVISYLIVLLSLCLSGARNSVAMSTVLFIIVIAIYLYGNKLVLKKVAVLVAACLSFFILWYFHIKFTPEWKSVISVMSIALETEENKCWLDCDQFPLEEDLVYEDMSNYGHIAMFKEGLLYIQEKPLGRGFAENAFGIAVSKKYEVDALGRFSHSGVIDLAIGTGIPGLLFFSAFLLSIFVISFKAFRATRGYSAFLLFLIAINFGVRMVVDSILRDHMLQQNMFLLGVMSTFMIQELREDRLLKSNHSNQVE